MKRNNFVLYNINYYDDQLSLFGRKVLRTLIKQWNIGDKSQRNRNNTSYRRHSHHTESRTITFNESNASVPIRDINSLNYEHEDIGDHFDFPLEQSNHTHAAFPKRTSLENFPIASASSPLPPPFLNPPRRLIVPTLGDLVADDDNDFDFPAELNSVTYARAPDFQKVNMPAPRYPAEKDLFSKNVIPIPKSAELVAVADLVLSQNTCEYTRDNLITTIDDDHSQPILETTITEEITDCLKFSTHVNKGKVSDTFEKQNDSHGIDWDDMFDTELLSTDTHMNEINPNEQSSSSKIFQINFPKHKMLVDSNNKTVKKRKINKETVKSNKQTNKSTSKKQTKVPELIHKKVKKVQCSTKPRNNKVQHKDNHKISDTVTNWLNNVDPNNPVEEAGDLLVVKDSVKTKKVEIVIEGPSHNKISKRVIQAQLANKGGIMKFDKPMKNPGEANVTDVSPKDQITKLDEKEKAKEKKSKPKFMAPIKSQIQVRDITYVVLSLEDLIRMNHIDMDKNIVLVLIYSNGFSQLNEQHTDDSCLPQGLLFFTDEKAFYLDKDNTETKHTLCEVLKSYTIVCYDGKAILKFLNSKFELQILNTTVSLIDTKIAGALLEPDSPPENFSELQKVAGSAAEFTVATECPHQKAAWYASLLERASDKLREKLIQEKLWDLFLDIEMQLLPVIADMELRGVCVDLEKLKSMEALLQSRMKLVEDSCAKAAGRSFQLTSHVQIRTLIYDELQLDKKSGLTVRGTITTGAKSTSEAMLRSLSSAHPLPKLILEYRQLHKAYTTFVAGIKQHVRDGIVKPSWVQTAAATGRIASNNPNLQAIPKVPFDLSEFSGSDENQDDTALIFRSVYMARPGHVILAADWRHVECRVFARAAADTSLQRALEAPDLFRRLAADWLKKPEDEVSSADRERTKRIVYASLYGAGPRKLMDILDVDYGQALSIGASFDRTFPALRAFGREVAERCRAAGGRVESLCGRARRLPHICSTDQQLRAQAERQALNFIVQGSAADICKWATVVASRALQDRGLRARLLLTIHDELVWEVFEDDLDAAAQVIRSSMESCGARAGLTSLPVAIAVGTNWGELQPYATPSFE